MKCKDCKFFKLTTKIKLGECGSNIFQYNGNTFKFDQELISDGALFLYRDYEGCDAEFLVHEDFGCIGFKKKEESKFIIRPFNVPKVFVSTNKFEEIAKKTHKELLNDVELYGKGELSSEELWDKWEPHLMLLLKPIIEKEKYVFEGAQGLKDCMVDIRDIPGDIPWKIPSWWKSKK